MSPTGTAKTVVAEQSTILPTGTHLPIGTDSGFRCHGRDGVRILPAVVYQRLVC